MCGANAWNIVGSRCPPVGVMAWPAATTRGPSIQPWSIALRSATSSRIPPVWTNRPRLRTVVNPDRSVRRALATARSVRTAGSSCTDTSGLSWSGPPSSRLTSMSMSPGSSVRSPRSTSTVPSGTDVGSTSTMRPPSTSRSPGSISSPLSTSSSRALRRWTGGRGVRERGMGARVATPDTAFPKSVNVLSATPPWQHRAMATIAELQDLTGKVAVVTGGSRGIGRAVVQALAEAGADVVVASRKLDACEAAAAEVHDSTGRRAEAVACHVGRWDDCGRLVAETLDRFGRLDVLINNAGMSPLYPSLDAVTEDLYDKTLAVNLKGPFRLGVLAGTHMVGHGGGAIVNVGTVGSFMASTNELPYACAKAGLNALTVGLADAFAPTVRVNAILPGPFRTDVTKAWPQEMLDGAFVPLKRLGEAEE